MPTRQPSRNVPSAPDAHTAVLSPVSGQIYMVKSEPTENARSSATLRGGGAPEDSRTGDMTISQRHLARARGVSPARASLPRAPGRPGPWALWQEGRVAPRGQWKSQSPGTPRNKTRVSATLISTAAHRAPCPPGRLPIPTTAPRGPQGTQDGRVRVRVGQWARDHLPIAAKGPC